MERERTGAFGAGADHLTIGSAAIVETHVSVVVFLGDRAYKVKKPVRTAFLDHSTLEARRAVCHREVELNRRVAPDVYLGVVDVVDDAGRTCDHLVAMRRMPSDRRLATLVTEGDATPATVASVARTMAYFHSWAERGPHIDVAGDPASLRRLWVDNFNEMMEFTPWLLPPETLGVIEAMALTYLDGRERLFAERIARGRIVDGHGDLLAADIFCLDDGPRILDCLEFDDRLRYGDVLLDIGFLAMDLERLGRPDLADAFLRAYREDSAETHPRSLEHHYIAYRALVRSKVACLVAADGQPLAAAEATALLDLSARHLDQGRVRLVLVGGTPGTGKTTLAEALADRLGVTVLRSDEIRKEQAGLPTTARAGAPFGQGLYSAGATDRVYDELLRRADLALGRGESVILDATWPSGRSRARAAEIARRTHSELVALCCDCPPALADERLATRLAHGADPSDATPDIARELRDRFDAWPEAHWIDTTDGTEAAVRAALARLGIPVAPAEQHAGAT